MSLKRKVYLGDSEPDEHTIVFYKGEMVDIICPKQPKEKEGAKVSSKRIPLEVREEVDKIVQQFNEEWIEDSGDYYLTRYRGRFLYLDRLSPGGPEPICRLEYTGDMHQWEFAIYKYSDERYDPDEWFFGDKHVDGTIEGALKAGMEAYPF